MASFTRKKNVNIGRVVTKLAVVLITLYAGGIIVDSLGDIMLCTNSPFYAGLTLIGWTVSDSVVMNASGAQFGGTCNTTAPLNGVELGTFNNVVTATTGSGMLAIIAVLGLASVVLEFVDFKF